MLDRATRCLNHGGRQTRCLQNSTLQSRRLLHSAFWRHGAGDLELLPTWCFSRVRALFEPDDITAHGDTTCDVVGPHTTAPFLLGFLYSRRTRAYLKRLTAYGAKTLSCRRSDLISTTRTFASTAGRHQIQGQVTISTPPAAPLSTPTPEVPFVAQDEAIAKLVGYLEANERGEYSDKWVSAWSLYSTTSPGCRTSSLVARLMNFLSKSPRALDAKRVTRLLGDLPLEERQPSDLVNAIEAHIRLGEVGRAFRLGELGLNSFAKSATTPIFDALMAHAFTNNYWQLALRIWDIRSQDTLDPAADIVADEAVLQKLSTNARFHVRVKALMSAIARFPDIVKSEQRRALVLSLVTRVFNGSGVQRFGRQNEQILEVLKQLELDVTPLYDPVINSTLKSRGILLKDRVKHALALYRLATSQEAYIPSLDTMRTLLNRAYIAKNTDAVYALFKDWPRYHNAPLTRDTHLFMSFFANHGDAESVEKAFFIHNSSHRDRSIKLYYPQLHVRALAADIKSVQTIMFDKLPKAELEPDIVCWNILLHAFQRADDLDGAMESMSRLLETSLRPDDYTFGTLMAIAADRGDLDLMEQLHQSAKSFGVPDTQIMNDCYVQALLHNHAANAAETFARSITEKRPDDKTHMWNQILTYHALDHARGPSLETTLRLSREMQRLGVPFDSMTFSAIMRAYIVQGKPAVAKRIMQDIMPRRNIKSTPFHYALLIDSYTNRGMFGFALEVEKDMLTAGVKPDISVQLALQKLHLSVSQRSTASGRFKLAEDSTLMSLKLAEELVEQSSGSAAMFSSKVPRLSERKFGILGAQPGAYFDFLLSFYSRARAFDMVDALLERYEEHSLQRPAEMRRTPLRLLISFMTLRYHQRDHEEVSRYWILAKRMAVASFGDTNSPPKGWLPPGKRTILARHLDVYMRSLAGQGEHGSILDTVHELFGLGLDLDNHNWNLYVQLIATKGFHLEAFSICERHLMPNFRGWRPGPRTPFQKSKGSPGMQFQDKRSQTLRFGELRVEFKTMVRLAHTVRVLRQRAPFDVKSQSTVDELREKAPKTFQAVMELPVREHPVATHVLGKVSKVMGTRRTMAGGSGGIV